MPVKTIADLLLKLNSQSSIRSAFTAALCGLDREVSTELPTMAVTIKNGTHRLIIGTPMMELLEDQQNHAQIGLVFAHEMVHIIQGHVPEMLRLLAEMVGDEDIELFKKIVPFSVDYAANSIGESSNIWTREQFLRSHPLKEDGSEGIYRGVLPSDMGLEWGLSFREYFQILWDLMRKDTPPPNWPGMLGDEDMAESSKLASAKSYLSSSSNSYGHIGDLSDILDLSDDELQDLVQVAEAAETNIKKEVVKNMKSRGFGSNPIVTSILESLKPPTRDWRALLHEFIEDAKVTGDDPVSTNIKPALAMLDLCNKSEFRVAPFPGKKKKPLWTIGVFIDSSASVSDGELLTFFSEVAGLVEAGTELLVIFCDSFIAHVTTVGVGESLPSLVYGRGGTSFDPPFQYIMEEDVSVDIVLYFTDGGAPLPHPSNRPAVPTLWCISKGGCIPGSYRSSADLNSGGTIDLDFGKALVVG
jgi:hypothetical protein